MTVAELIETLKVCNPTDLVVLASDAEGNDYHTMEDISTAHYDRRELVGKEQGEPCIVLWP